VFGGDPTQSSWSPESARGKHAYDHWGRQLTLMNSPAGQHFQAKFDAMMKSNLYVQSRRAGRLPTGGKGKGIATRCHVAEEGRP